MSLKASLHCHRCIAHISMQQNCLYLTNCDAVRMHTLDMCLLCASDRYSVRNGVIYVPFSTYNVHLLCILQTSLSYLHYYHLLQCYRFLDCASAVFTVGSDSACCDDGSSSLALFSINSTSHKPWHAAAPIGPVACMSTAVRKTIAQHH
jgi:hypothetical protein